MHRVHFFLNWQNILHQYFFLHNILGCCKSRQPRSSRKKKGGYTICKQTPPQKTDAYKDHDPENPEFSDENEDQNYTLRTVESLEVDAMLDKFSPIKGPKKSQMQNNSKIVTSTPRKKSKEKKTREEMDAIFLELSGEAESQPQFYPTHYFNILNIFGIGNVKLLSIRFSFCTLGGASKLFVYKQSSPRSKFAQKI